MQNLSVFRGEKITFEQMPEAISYLLAEVFELKNLLLNPIEKNITEIDRMFTINELCSYLPEKPAKQTVYGWINKRLIEYEKHGRRVYFRKSVVDTWLQNGRKIDN